MIKPSDPMKVWTINVKMYQGFNKLSFGYSIVIFSTGPFNPKNKLKIIVPKM